MLEKTLIDLAERRLKELESYISNPDEEFGDAMITITYAKVTQLVEFGHIYNSGLSDEGIKQLDNIETASEKLYQPFL